jgi:hypothetical protein
MVAISMSVCAAGAEAFTEMALGNPVVPLVKLMAPGAEVGRQVTAAGSQA